MFASEQPEDTEVLNLLDLLVRSAQRTPDAVAVIEPDGSWTYREVDRLANRIANALTALGVDPGDRVGIWLDKSAQAVAAMQGVLRLGGVYVPLDPLAPAARIREMMRDCGMGATITTPERAPRVLIDELAGTPCLYLEDAASGTGSHELDSFSDEPAPAPGRGADDPAYILYTSGSTGKPKGVCISHRNALAFIEWTAGELRVTEADRFSNHAPFHFDLSVLDLYVAFMAGAPVVLIPDGMSYVPGRLVEFIIEHEITIWYSVPSALILMMDQGGLLDVPALPVRAFVFAGEPFPIKHLRRLFDRWSSARFLNFYGPTETNVCTFYEVTDLHPDRTKPVPIGRACSGDRVWAVQADGTEVGPGEEGELMVSGPTVHLGYWGRPPQGKGPYATGDLVRLEADGNYEYIGRRDHMVKVRGHRIELGDVETALTEHPRLREVAVIVSGSGVEARLVAVGVCADEEAPTLLDVKRHCAERLPRYMIVDEIHILPALPRTRNGKIDRLELTAEFASSREVVR